MLGINHRKTTNISGSRLQMYHLQLEMLQNHNQWTPFTNLNSSSPEQNGRHFEDDIFKYIFLKEKVRFLAKISLKFVPKGPIDDSPALV